jgi:hypothetical protein
MPVCQLIINNRIPRKPYAPNEALYGMAGKPFLARAQPCPSDGTSGMARADPSRDTSVGFRLPLPVQDWRSNPSRLLIWWRTFRQDVPRGDSGQ